ncbi:hypothetical protein M8J76_010081 [Diaphorina citri]|nr:hypothetical protein M8J76_010081 [Diaphorina citri]
MNTNNTEKLQDTSPCLSELDDNNCPNQFTFLTDIWSKILNVVLPCDDDTQAGSSSSSPSPRRTMSQLSLTIIQPNKRGRSSVSESRAAASVENLRYTKKPKLAQTCEPCISSGGTFKEIQDNRDKKEKSIFLTGGTFKEIQDNRDKKEKSIFLTGESPRRYSQRRGTCNEPCTLRNQGDANIGMNTNNTEKLQDTSPCLSELDDNNCPNQFTFLTDIWSKILNVVLPCDDDTQAGSSSSSPSPRRTMSQLSLTIIQPNKRGRSSVSESRAAASVENLRYTKKPKLAQTCEPCISSSSSDDKKRYRNRTRRK